MKTYLYPQPTQENPHVAKDYPTGFTLRCQRRTWREFRRGYGFRIMRQTSNPRADGGQNLDTPSRWCAVKPSNYWFIVMLYIDSETGYIESTIINHVDEKGAQLAREILDDCGDNISDSDKSNLSGVIATWEKHSTKLSLDKPE